MPHLVEIAFKGNRRDFFRWDGAEPPRRGASVLVEGDRGEDLGRVHATGELALHRYTGVAHGALTHGALPEGAPVDGSHPGDGGHAAVLPGDGAGPRQRVLRPATDAEVVRAAELPALDDTARRDSAERVRAHGLAMKITDAEWQWDRRKLTLYFTAEKRVDFRALVRDLAAHFRARIELKQIGVRDEAKRLSGVGRCGREYCSAAWLPELRPVNLNVAKDQHLSLNPTQISGACGRLMCSLRYEHDFYVQQRKRFPKEGRVLATARGEEKVLGNDIFRERVTLRALDGETRTVPLAELRAELDAAAAVVLSSEPVDDAGPDVTAGELMAEAAPTLVPLPAPPEPAAPSVVSPVATIVVPPAAPSNPAAAEAVAMAEAVTSEAAGADEADASAAGADAIDAGADADASEDGSEDAEDSEDAQADGAAPEASGDRPRRRRGRRGGRRNRPGRSDA